MDANSGAAALAAARADLAVAPEENGRLLDLVSKVTHHLRHIIQKHIIIITYAVPAKRGKVRPADKLQVEAAKVPTPCWTRQIHARPNQPWARRSVFVPPPASRGQEHMTPVISQVASARSFDLVGLGTPTWAACLLG
jgi:hypothetical protein